MTLDRSTVPFFLGTPSAMRHGRKVNASPFQLELRIGSTDRLSDAKGVWAEKEMPLDQQLVEVVAGILTALEMQRREDAVAAHREAERRREEILAREERERQRQEDARRKWLAEEANAHVTAENVRAFVAKVQRCGRLRGETLTLEQLESWTAWALQAADALDPILSATATEQTSLRSNRWGGWTWQTGRATFPWG